MACEGAVARGAPVSEVVGVDRADLHRKRRDVHQTEQGESEQKRSDPIGPPGPPVEGEERDEEREVEVQVGGGQSGSRRRRREVRTLDQDLPVEPRAA